MRYPASPAIDKPSARKFEEAVYAHIQAVRALGKTQVGTAEIARALGISISDVEKTISALRVKGVKRV
jgi:hypothetical protein